MNSNPHILFDGNSRKASLIPIFSLFRIFRYDFIVYFTYAATSSTEIDDVTKLVMYRIFNTNL